MSAATSTDTAKKLPPLLKKLKSKHKVETPAPRDPTMQLITAFFQWRSTTAAAEEALDHIFTAVVDINEMRVTPDLELIQLIGEDYPFAAERVRRLRDAMQTVFAREHSLEMQSIASQGKKEQKFYLETIPGLPAYVMASVALLGFGIHAMPVDENLIELLEAEQVIDPGMKPADVESLLLRHIKATDAADAHLVFQAWVDASFTSKRTSKKK